MPRPNAEKIIPANFRPNKLLGQNFLRDKNILAKIVHAAALTKEDRVLEVGPGEGILTQALAQQAGHVLAVEKDRRLAEQLKIKFSGNEKVAIVEADILDFLESAPFAGQPYKVVANIPYYLTAHLIRRLLESPDPPRDIILMVQKEVAQRLCARPPRMSLLAVSVQFYSQPKLIARVSKNSFWPKPKVDSAIIRLSPRPAADSLETIDAPAFFKILHAGFSQPRKQLLNNLSRELALSREKISVIMENAGLEPNQRAETLDVPDWLRLARSLKTA